MTVDYQERVWQGELIGYLRLSDGAYIPLAEDNADFIQLQAQIAEGYMPLPADPPPGVSG